MICSQKVGWHGEACSHLDCASLFIYSISVVLCGSMCPLTCHQCLWGCPDENVEIHVLLPLAKAKTHILMWFGI